MRARARGTAARTAGDRPSPWPKACPTMPRNCNSSGQPGSREARASHSLRESPWLENRISGGSARRRVPSSSTRVPGSREGACTASRIRTRSWGCQGGGTGGTWNTSTRWGPGTSFRARARTGPTPSSRRSGFPSARIRIATAEKDTAKPRLQAPGTGWIILAKRRLSP